MRYSNIALIRLMLISTALWSIWNAIEPVHSIGQIAYTVLFLPLSTLLLGLTFLQEDKDDDDFGGGIMIPIIIKDKY